MAAPSHSSPLAPRESDYADVGERAVHDCVLWHTQDELRMRKQRDRKPFAVMVRDLREAAEFAELCADERALLCSNERPIVLLRRQRACGLAAAIAPGTARVGLLLPYTPLHHLLLALHLAALPDDAAAHPQQLRRHLERAEWGLDYENLELVLLLVTPWCWCCCSL